MGDAGYILWGAVGREVLSAGTIIFAVIATGGQILAGQIALDALSDSRLCLMLYTGIFAIPTLVFSFPRTLDSLSWLSIPSVLAIIVAGIVGMIGAGIYPIEGRTTSLFLQPTFVNAFVAVTNPVFAYVGHFMFFILISEMRNPRDAMKAIYLLQGFATTYYIVFAIVTHWYLGDGVKSPSFSSLPTVCAKAAYGIAIPNFLIAGSLYAHTASKLIFLRLFRHSEHLHSHTLLGWGTWTFLILLINAAAFVLAVGVPIFSYLIGIAASLFASWYTYGVAGAFWLHDSYHLNGEGVRAWRKYPTMFALSVMTFAAGGFVCVAGTYAIIKLIISAYESGCKFTYFSISAFRVHTDYYSAVPPPFQC